MKKVTLFLLLSIFFGQGSLISQTFLFFENNNRNPIKIPFQRLGGLDLISIKINEVPLRFIFDTGAQQNVLLKPELKSFLNLEYYRTVEIHGADLSQPLLASFTKVEKLELPDGTFASSTLLVLNRDVLGLDRILGTSVDGILGSPIFSNSVLHVNNKRGYFKLIPHESFNQKPKLGYYYFPISIESGRPYLYTYISIDGEDPKLYRLLLDTGSSVPLLLYAHDSLGITMPQKVIQGNLGTGLGGELKGYLGRVRSLSFGDYSFQNFPASFQLLPDSTVFEEADLERRQGLLGNGILSRFNYYIDYHNELIYMKPREKLKNTFSVDRSGLSLIAGGSRFEYVIVANVLDNSPASEVGIEKGDRILKIQGMDANNLRITDIQRLLSKKAGKQIKLLIEHNGIKMRKKIKLRELL